MNGADGGVDLDLAGGVLEQEHTAHDTVETDSGQLGAAGDPVGLTRVLVHSQAVGKDSGDAYLQLR